MRKPLTCRELVIFLASYLEGELSRGRTAAFEDHLRRCPECRMYVRQYTEAVRLGREAFRTLDEPVPETVPERLIAAIRATIVE